MSTQPTIPPSGKPPGLEVFKSFEALKERYHELKEKGYDFEFVLAKYKE